MEQSYTAERVSEHSLANPARKTNFALKGLTLLLLLLGFAYLVISRQSPPPTVSAQAPPDVFSSGRAMNNLRVIAERPHPIGSAEHEKVREHIFKELGALGVEPQVQKITGAYSRQGNSIRAATVQNVLARLKGTENSKAVLLSAHYDSVPNSPGASDDGAAVVALLETARALKNSPPLKNDVIYLFTDAEEVGLLGARGFMKEHPWAKDVGLVLNFDARGSSGPVTMFETSNGNEQFIGEFAKSAPRPVANSLAYEVYRMLPNDTDLTAFREGNLPGLNFAFIDSFTNYHAKLDDLANIDERSLQHQGSYALALARHFGNQPLDAPPAKSNAVYFDLFGATLVHYSTAWVLPFTILVGLCFVGVLILGLRRGRLRFGKIILGSVAFLLSMAGSAVAGITLWWIARMLGSLLGRSLQSSLYYSHLYIAGFVAITVAVCASVYLLFRRRTGVENLTAGALLLMLILLLAISVLIPGGSYLLAWPLLSSLVALAFMLFAPEHDSTSLKSFVVLLLCALPVILLLVPVIHQIFVALGIDLGIVGVVLLVIMLGMLIPQLSLMTTSRRWLLPGAAALVALGFVIAATLLSGVDKNRPQSNSVQYVLNADTGQAVWASNDSKADGWTSQFFAANAERGSLNDFMPTREGSLYLKSPAPVAALPAATMTVLDDTTNNDVRTIRLNVASPYPALSISTLEDSGATILASAINGVRFENKGTQPPAKGQPAWMLQYWGLPGEDIQLTLEVKAAQPLKLRMVGQSYELPEIPAMALKPRPDHMIPARFTNSDTSFVSKSMTF